MEHKKTLQDIFNDDPFGLLNVKPANSPARNEDERLTASFQEINNFYEINNREPVQGAGIKEHELYSRLKGIREHQVKMEMLHTHDKFGLLNYTPKVIASMEDIFNDDTFGLLDEDTAGLFDLKHVKRQDDRASADFVAKRKPCKNFADYEPIFKEVQKDLKNSKRKIIPFRLGDLKEGDFYVHNGVLLYLESVDYEKNVQQFKSGTRVRKDGRTRVIFENGTESNMLYRSLYKVLLANGRSVSEHIDKVGEMFVEKFHNITDEDKEAGYIYILKSKSNNPKIKEIEHLYKIGYSTTAIAERIKNASQEPTYLMAEVIEVASYKCYNMNPQKLEQLLHNFFGASCLNIDVWDSKGNRHIPREWFIAPYHVIDNVIHLIENGDIVNYKYDSDKMMIVEREEK